MTEYDYSPDRYERYLATQQRIARWAENTSQFHPSNPFVASPTQEHSPRSPSSRSSSSYRGSHSPDSYSSGNRYRSTSDAIHHRPEPSRSYTAPTLVQRSSVEHPRSSHHSRRSSRSSASRHSRRSSHSHSTTSTFKTVTPNANGPTHIQRSNPEIILVPIDGGGCIIIPPKGTRLEVMGQSSYVETGRQRNMNSEKPLLKRLFSSFSSMGKHI